MVPSLKELAGPAVTLYHYPCNDGVYAALASYLYHKQAGLHCRFAPLSVYRSTPIRDLGLQGNEVVYFLDYSGPDGFAAEVARTARQVVVLDHHKTAAEQLGDPSSHPPNLAVSIDFERSGATIALDFFSPAVSDDLRCAFKMVEDGDLWRWRLEGSKAFAAGFRALGLEMDALRNPGIFDELAELSTSRVVELGAAELTRQAEVEAGAMARSFRLHLAPGAPAAPAGGSGWGECLGVLATQEEALVRSQLGNSLAKASQAAGLQPVGVIAYEEPGMGAASTSHYKVSLRSLGDWDTTAVSQAFGGGGHRNASSCLMPREVFDAWRMRPI